MQRNRVLPSIVTLIGLLAFLSVDRNLVGAEDQLPGMGAMGDSLTDEYSRRAVNYGDASAFCWVDLLAQLRGPTSLVPELTFGDYEMTSMGSPRGLGYTYNWALAGTNTATLLSQGQHTGVATQVREGLVQQVAVFIGTNDFQPASPHGIYEAIYNGVTPFTGCDGKSYASVRDYVDSIVERYTIALDTVLGAGGQPVMGTIVDFGMAPRTASAQGYSDPEKRQNVTDAVMLLNDGLKSLATSKGLPIVNMFDLFHRFYVDREPSLVGGISIIKEAPSHPDGRYAILPDGAHPGTVLQGLMANALIEACNRSYGTNFTPLSDQEILASARISIAEEDVTFFDIRAFITTKYSGGSGTAEDPYQIATAADLITLGETREDYDKHFKLIADIDLDPNLPGRKVFTRAVIAPDTDPNDPYSQFQGSPFSGVLDGNGHTISRLEIRGGGYLGLFGALSGTVHDVGLVDVNIAGQGGHVGGLVGLGYWDGHVTHCYCAGAVRGNEFVGGLIGRNSSQVTQCRSSATVNGDETVGGLTGYNSDSVAHCYSTGAVTGLDFVGGLVGMNDGSIATSYSVSAVIGDGSHIGGLVGTGWGGACHCFWDIQTSGQTQREASGINGYAGLSTAEMQTAATFYSWGRCEPIWTIDEGKDYPRLCWENRPGELIKPISLSDSLLGDGTKDNPYLLYTAEELNLVGSAFCDWDKHFKLMADIDLSGFSYERALIGATDALGCPSPISTDMFYEFWYAGSVFAGTFDGNGHTISHLTIDGGSDLGLFGASQGKVENLGVMDANVVGSGECVGILVAVNRGSVINCAVSGRVQGGREVGGLVGLNYAARIAESHSTATVTGGGAVGGLAGLNVGTLLYCYSTGLVSGNRYVGGLVGYNNLYIGESQNHWWGESNYSLKVSDCYSTASVAGGVFVGGLAGGNLNGSLILNCYSAGVVSGENAFAGLVGFNSESAVIRCFWDTETSGQVESLAGTGLTTAEMQTGSTFLETGWDLVDETANGTDDIWWILEGQDYPRLWWELPEEN